MVVAAAALGLSAGLGLGGGALVGLAQGKSARSKQKRAKRKRAALSGFFQQGLAEDPLFNLILGQAGGVSEQSVFNPRNVFKKASAQVETLVNRRQEDSLEQLAAFGIDRNSPQAQFLAKRFMRDEVRQLGSLRDFIDTSFIQSSPQIQLQDAAQQADLTSLRAQLGVGGL